MTDARYPERWQQDRRFLRLSDSAHRTFMGMLVYAVSNRTDGHLTTDDLDLIPRARNTDIPELLASELLAHDGTDLRITVFEDTQTTAAQLVGLEHQRRAEREKKARQRAHARDDHRLCRSDTCTLVPRDTARDNPKDTTRDTKDRQGQARTGSNSSTNPHRDTATSPGFGSGRSAGEPGGGW